MLELYKRYQVLNNQLDNVTDEDLIDAIILEMIAVDKKIKFLRKGE